MPAAITRCASSAGGASGLSSRAAFRRRGAVAGAFRSRPVAPPPLGSMTARWAGQVRWQSAPAGRALEMHGLVRARLGHMRGLMPVAARAGRSTIGSAYLPASACL